MSPLKIEILLRMRCRINPFDGYTEGQKFSLAMRDAFQDFRHAGLIPEYLRIEHDWDADKDPMTRLTLRGQDLVRRLQEVEPAACEAVSDRPACGESWYVQHKGGVTLRTVCVTDVTAATVCVRDVGKPHASSDRYKWSDLEFVEKEER